MTTNETKTPAADGASMLLALAVAPLDRLLLERLAKLTPEAMRIEMAKRT
jgi:hypothetical protein